MGEAVKRLHAQAALLNEAERAELAYLLLESLDQDQSNCDTVGWNQELARRVDSIKTSQATGIPADEVHERVRGIYK